MNPTTAGVVVVGRVGAELTDVMIFVFLHDSVFRLKIDFCNWLRCLVCFVSDKKCRGGGGESGVRYFFLNMKRRSRETLFGTNITVSRF